MLRRIGTRLSSFRSAGPPPLEHTTMGVSTDLSAQPLSSALHEQVLGHRRSNSLFGGSIVASSASLTGFGLFCLTFGYHIGKPVYDAYTREDGEDDKDDEGNDED